MKDKDKKTFEKLKKQYNAKLSKLLDTMRADYPGLRAVAVVCIVDGDTVGRPDIIGVCAGAGGDEHGRRHLPEALMESAKGIAKQEGMWDGKDCDDSDHVHGEMESLPSSGDETTDAMLDSLRSLMEKSDQ